MYDIHAYTRCTSMYTLRALKVMIMLAFGPYMEAWKSISVLEAPYIKNFKIDELSLLNNSWFYCVCGDYVKS